MFDHISQLVTECIHVSSISATFMPFSKHYTKPLAIKFQNNHTFIAMIIQRSCRECQHVILLLCAPQRSKARQQFIGCLTLTSPSGVLNESLCNRNRDSHMYVLPCCLSTKFLFISEPQYQRYRQGSQPVQIPLRILSSKPFTSRLSLACKSTFIPKSMTAIVVSPSLCQFSLW